MAESMSRRSFIKAGALLGTSLAIDGFSALSARSEPGVASYADLAAVKGTDPFDSTVKAVDLLGGMRTFVPRQSNVGLLINSPWGHPGSYVHPDIALAVMKLCLDAGAREVGVFKGLSEVYWRRSVQIGRFRNEAGALRDVGGDYVEVSIPRGKSLKRAEVARGLLECDAFVNVSIAKDHTGTRYSGVNPVFS